MDRKSDLEKDAAMDMLTEIEFGRKEALEQRQSGAAQKRKKRRQQNEAFHREREAAIAAKNEQTIAQSVNKVLSAITGHNTSHISVTNNPDYFKGFTDIENATGHPVSMNDERFKALGTKWIHEPGVTLVMLGDECICAIRIRSDDEFKPEELLELRTQQQTMMDWTRVVPDIKTNAAHKSKVHGVNAAENTIVRNGLMFAAGWHQGQERGITLASYAAKSGMVEQYTELFPKLRQVSHFFRDGLATLYPKGYMALRNMAQSHSMPNFDDLRFDGEEDVESPFANSLTITRGNFSNFLHIDKDAIDVAYGGWWAARVHHDGSFATGGNVSHSHIKGGGFVLGNYGVGIDFERCEGYVEIYWRGKADHHATLASTSDHDYTRFGTSIQITQKGLQALDNFWNFDEAERRIRLRNVPDRIQQYSKAPGRASGSRPLFSTPASPTRKSRGKAKGRSKLKRDYDQFAHEDADGD